MRRHDAPPATVGDLMSEDLLAILPDDRVGRARDVMLSVGVHAVLVMDGNEVLGIVTSTDLIDNWPDDEPIATVMTAAPAAISVEATVREAAESMISSRTHHLLVEDGHEVIGILSSFDLLDALTVAAEV